MFFDCLAKQPSRQSGTVLLFVLVGTFTCPLLLSSSRRRLLASFPDIGIGSRAPCNMIEHQVEETAGCSETRRFELELEFVQCLASPDYLNCALESVPEL